MDSAENQSLLIEHDIELNNAKHDDSLIKNHQKRRFMIAIGVSASILLSTALFFGGSKISSVSSLFGGSGGGYFEKFCDPGMYVTTIYGRGGSHIDSVGIKCGNNNDKGTHGGTGGGNAFSKTCGNGFSSVRYGYNSVVGSLWAKCAYDNNEQTLNVGEANQWAETVCPAGQVMIGFKVRSGSLIDNLEFVCGGNYNNLEKYFCIYYYYKSSVAGFGGSGGAGSSRKCSQSYVSAIYGRAGGLVDRFGVKCGANFQDAGYSGGDGGGDVGYDCIGGYSSVKVSFGKYVGYISAFCKASNAYQSIGAGTHGDGTGVVGELRCSGNQILSGVDLNSGAYIDRATFFCGGSLRYFFR
jgi:hypothetical protein